MNRLTDYQTTTDLDLGAAYMVVTGRQPHVVHSHDDKLASIEMVDDAVTRQLMLAYACGQLALNIKRFATCRAWLYRQVKEVMS